MEYKNNSTYYNEAVTFNKYLAKVFIWMTAGLAITFFVATFLSKHANVIGYSTYIFIFIINMSVAIAMFKNIFAKSKATCIALFMVNAVLDGITLSIFFKISTPSSIITAFTCTTILFAIMVVYAKITKQDLSEWSSFLFMGLIGVVVALLINIFIHSTMLTFVTSTITIIIMLGFTAYDIQNIKGYYEVCKHQPEQLEKFALIGAFQLHIDFIVLFKNIITIIDILNITNGRD